MTARIDPLPMGSSTDNASRDADRQVREALIELRAQLASGKIDQAQYDSMISALQ